MEDLHVRRLDLGWFVRPAEETGAGTPRVEACLGYAVSHADGLLLFDTGMGSGPEVTHVTNCHLHFDHCGGNPLVADRPPFVQRTELASARTTTDYTLPELVEGSRYIELDGESHDTASAYGAHVLAWQANLPLPPAWLERLQELDPKEVHFAHDHAVQWRRLPV